MNRHRTLLALTASLVALATPAAATITIGFTESTTEGQGNPAPTVANGGQFTATGGLISNVTLLSFFASAPTAFSYTFNLLEPPGQGAGEFNPLSGVSDQVTFSGLGTSLLITFTSDPLNFIPGAPYASLLETGGDQIITLPPNMPTGRDSLVVTARSELDNPVPEPATWALMVLGFAGVGMALRGRRRATLPQLA